ncbi:MAG: hypothetical protein EAZ42_04670 [Verrucomicrobia bacterium]|nr:MAG: hypothetical protein EAZ42_04670 [Verrucomicrobiota bacterium]
MLEHGASFIDAHREIEAKHGPVDFEGLVEAVETLRGNGFFKYEDVNKVRQAELMEELWNHKPRRIQLLMAQGCNLGCRYCYAWRNGSNQKHTLMPWSVAKTAVDYLVWRSGTRS